MAVKIGKAWTIEEDQRLRELIISEADFTDISRSLGRSEKAVKARAYILRLSLRRINVRRRDMVELGLKAKREKT
jgi:hypothetical protein